MYRHMSDFNRRTALVVLALLQVAFAPERKEIISTEKSSLSFWALTTTDGPVLT